MQRRAAATIGGWLWLALLAPLAAADFWQEKPFTAWSDREVRRMLTDSPWAHEVTVLTTDSALASRVGGLSGGIVGGGVGSRSGVGAAGGGVGGDGAGNLGGGSFMAPPRRTRLTVRWASALPVKLALQRNQSSEAGAISSPQPEDAAEEPYYRIAVAGLPFEFTAVLGSAADLQDVTWLRPRNREPFHPVGVRLLDDGDRLTLEFTFARTENLSVADREVEFVTQLGGSTVKRTFRLRDMMFAGGLAL
jgi:hypothetical protein